MNGRAMCWKNGAIMPASEASVSVFDHGLLYGDGVFEGIRFYCGKPFRLEAHLRRLADSARAIALDLPLDARGMERAILETIDASGMTEGYVRLIATRGEGPLGLDVSGCAAPTVLAIVDALRMIPERIRRRGVAVRVASLRRAAPDALEARVKSLNYLGSVLARLEAVEAGADEAILLNARGFVSEASAANVFVARDGVLMTPPPSDGALEGVTRGAAIEIAEELGIPVRVRSLTRHDLLVSDECFLTGTGAELVPIREVDGRAMPETRGEMFLAIERGFRAMIERECGGRP